MAMKDCFYNLMFLEDTKTDEVREMPEGKRSFPIYLAGAAKYRAGWSNYKAPPEIGAPVTINFNGLGSGTVESYFVEHGWLGIRVHLAKQPEWHKKQNPNRPYALVFGAEIAQSRRE